MTINSELDGTKLTVTPIGNIDTMTSPELAQKLKLDGVTELVIDLMHAAYVSSAGLRVLFTAQNTMSKQGRMKLVNVQKAVMDVFDTTGLTDIFTIE